MAVWLLLKHARLTETLLQAIRDAYILYIACREITQGRPDSRRIPVK